MTAPRFKLTSQRQKVSRLPTEPPGRPVSYPVSYSYSSTELFVPGSEDSYPTLLQSSHCSSSNNLIQVTYTLRREDQRYNAAQRTAAVRVQSAPDHALPQQKSDVNHMGCLPITFSRLVKVTFSRLVYYVQTKSRSESFLLATTPRRWVQQIGCSTFREGGSLCLHMHFTAK